MWFDSRLPHQLWGSSSVGRAPVVKAFQLSLPLINSNMRLHEIIDVQLVEVRRGPGHITRHEESHCLRKQRYPTLKQARHALLRCWQKGRKERSVYPCEYCGQFHLTSKKPEGIAHT